MYPSEEEFKRALRSRPFDWIIDRYLLRGLPFYSAREPALHDEMLRAVSTGLRVTRPDIGVVGSARVGFSLAPYKFGEPFSESSDLDVIVVSSRLFDASWVDILRRRTNPSPPLSTSTRASLRRHRKKHYVYNGWMYPDDIVEVLEIGPLWLRTFRGLARIPELAGRPVGARLYRTWDHARLYLRWSLSMVKESQDKIE